MLQRSNWLRSQRHGGTVLRLTLLPQGERAPRYPEEQFACAALDAGANGYVAKDAEPGDLLAATRRIAQGGSWLSTGSAARVREMPGRPPASDQPPHFRLTVREMQIMMAIVDGKSLTEIGADLFLGVKAVSTYRSRILDKLQLGGNSELVRYAMQHALLDWLQ